MEVVHGRRVKIFPQEYPAFGVVEGRRTRRNGCLIQLSAASPRVALSGFQQGITPAGITKGFL
ncbi:MAG: hypothetical protein JZU50_01965 [Desulfobulbaceae bacterium]|nr:hypothetical protein [Desulfobulbaceae bacterium]